MQVITVKGEVAIQVEEFDRKEEIMMAARQNGASNRVCDGRVEEIRLTTQHHPNSSFTVGSLSVTDAWLHRLATDPSEHREMIAEIKLSF